MFEDTLGAEHLPVVLTVELDLLAGMDFAVPYGTIYCYLLGTIIDQGFVSDTHGESCQDLIIYRQRLGRLMVLNLVIRTLDHVVPEHLPDTVIAERMTAR